LKKYVINILPFAEDDLFEIVTYFKDINPEVSKNIYMKIKGRINSLVEFPEKGSLVPELEKQGFLKYRQLIEGNYRIIYSILEDSVFIHLIVDSRRNLETILIKKLQRV